MHAKALTGCAVILLTATVAAKEGSKSAAQPAPPADPLAQLAALGDAVAQTGPEGGGSIRAKKDVNTAMAQRLGDHHNLEAKVEAVRTGAFPVVALRVRVLRPAKEGPGKSVARNQTLAVVPKLEVKGAHVDMKDPTTLINAGAYYLKPGDRVMVRLGAKKAKFWEADYIERR